MADRSELWSAEVGAIERARVVPVGSDAIAVYGPPGELFALALEDGATRWSTAAERFDVLVVDGTAAIVAVSNETVTLFDAVGEVTTKTTLDNRLGVPVSGAFYSANGNNVSAVSLPGLDEIWTLDLRTSVIEQAVDNGFISYRDGELVGYLAPTNE